MVATEDATVIVATEESANVVAAEDGTYQILPIRIIVVVAARSKWQAEWSTTAAEELALFSVVPAI